LKGSRFPPSNHKIGAHSARITPYPTGRHFGGGDVQALRARLRSHRPLRDISQQALARIRDIGFPISRATSRLRRRLSLMVSGKALDRYKPWAAGRSFHSPAEAPKGLERTDVQKRFAQSNFAAHPHREVGFRAKSTAIVSQMKQADQANNY
jgi:hypothetical protein